MKDEIVFLHPPSIFDFRERPILWGPINDLVPSKSVFEMYPIGFVSLASTLDREGYDTRIINVALKMLKSSSFDPGSYLSKLDPELFAIDLHWLPHVHGSIELAKTCKRVHPDVPVVFGGLSASYYHEEVLEEVSAVDYVIRGDSAEIPLLKLVREITGDCNLDTVPNLSYRDGSEVMVNGISSVPNKMDSFALDYDYVIRNLIEKRNLDILPFQEFIQRPIMAVLTRKGCAENCPGCGGSNYSYSKFCNRNDLALRSPKKVVEDLKKVEEFRTPAFVIGDLAHPDEKYGREIFHLIKKSGLDIPVVFEFFTPPSRSFLMEMGDSVRYFSIEMSPESGVEKIRQRAGRRYTNDELTNAIDASFEAGCNQFDLYFMIGLSGQTEDSLSVTLDFVDKLLGNNRGNNLIPFISPYTPFLDPGSLAFEFPEKFGFTKYASTLMDHYKLLDEGFTWKDFLSYRTDWMSREDLVRITYKIALEFARIKEKHGIISRKKLTDLEEKISLSKRMIRISDAREDENIPGDQLKASLQDMKERLLIDRGELDWSNGITPQRVFAALKKSFETLFSGQSR